MGGHKSYLYGFVLADWIACVLGWSLFFYIRKYIVNNDIALVQALYDDPKYWLGILIIPTCWLIIFSIAGTYEPLYQKTRVSLLMNSIWSIMIGSLGLLFLVLFDDEVTVYISYTQSFVILFSIFFMLVVSFRMIIFGIYRQALMSGRIPLDVLVVAAKSTSFPRYLRCQNILKEISIEDLKHYLTDRPSIHEICFIEMNDKMTQVLLSCAYLLDDCCQIRVLTWATDANMSLVPLRYDVDTDSFNLFTDQMNPTHRNVKRLIDISLSIVSLIILIPVVIGAAIAIRLNSSGSILYKQSRVGRGMIPFSIYKFRTMYHDAEAQGPQLSHKNDARITSVGSFLRKYRIDEIPQFINVIRGQMSIVGPRPERPYFVDQILKENESLSRLYSVRPGITSWGQVKYGYASTIKEIIDRTKFDLLYLNNRSLFLDLRIMLSTIKVVLAGKGH